MLIFNEFDLEQLIIHEDIEIEELPPRDNKCIEINSRQGDIYTGYRYGKKKITIPFKMDARGSSSEESTNNYVNMVRQLKKVLHTEYPARLYLPDELDKYYYAVIEELECQEILVGVGEGSMVFICHDPFAYSADAKLIEASEDNVFTIDNKGSMNANPIINVAFNSDAHFVQATNWDGKTILVGSRPSADSNSSNPSNVVISDPCESTSNWLPSGNVVDSGRVVEGSATVSDNGAYITSGNFGSSTEASWHGAGIRRNFGENVRDFEVRATMIMKSKFGGQDSGGTSTTPGNYQTTANVNMRSGRGTSYRVLTTIPKGKTVNLTDIQKGWGKVSYGGKTGYISTTYTKVASKSVNIKGSRSENHDKEENKMARVELYGFDSSGQKLFKFVIRDSDYWYEYIEPEAFIGNDLILEDGKQVPKPKTTTEKDGDKTVTKNVESGKFGEWNNFYGEFIIKRETINLKQNWWVEINKIQGGKVVKSLKTKTKLVNSKYPTGDLNHVVLWFGQHKDRPVPEELGLTHLKVSRLNEIPVEDDVVNFANGDELEIDCIENKVRLNGLECMEKVDIGSEFFGCDSGISQFVIKSDDSVYSSAIIQERWI